jgi:hypothetical protein
MRAGRGIALATWVLEHLSAGMDGKALAGDLLEELAAGRSAGWYWRQVACAVAANAIAASRVYALPMIFSAGWSSLYPGWMAIGRGIFAGTILSYSRSLEWPYSALLEPVLGVLPVIVFVWVGLLVYLSLPFYSSSTSSRELSGEPSRKLSVLRLVGGFSVGFNVLLMASAALLPRGWFRGMGLQYRMVENFYTNVRLAIVVMPLMLSLYAAILCARPRSRRRSLIG